MIKTFDFSGKTEEEAELKGLRELNMDREDVHIELIERARSGFLGIGSSPAKIRISFEVPDEKTEEPVKAEAPVQTKKTAEPQQKKEKAVKPVAQTQTVAGKAKDVETFLNGLFEKMGVEATPVISENEDGISVVLTGKDPGALIGRRGETLDAIQHLANYAVNKSGGSHTRISIDAENYRERRNEALERLAVKVAGKVTKYHKNMTLEPMNSYERHVIHTALQNTPNITTYSVGTEPNRRIVVAYERTGGQRSQPKTERPVNRDVPKKEEAPVTVQPSTETKKYREWV